MRITRSRVHRLIGRFYLGLVAIGGSTGIIVGMYTESYIRQLAFLTLVVLWIFTGWKGYQTARQKRFDSHRIWMIRNYAVTLVAATTRLITPLCILIYLAGHRDMPFQGIEPILRQILEVNIWVGIVINIIIAEWMIVHRVLKRSDPNKKK